jgi:dephospho-CoA kinase
MLLRVGLTGGLASGKSVVGRELERLGCFRLDADALGHEVLLPGGEAYTPVLAEFGPAVLDAERRIDRKKLGGVVFADPERLKALSAIVHPAVRRLGNQRIEAFGSDGILVYEAAILVETGGYRDFDRLIVAACPEELQIERAMLRDGSNRESVLARLRQQMPLAEKIGYADYVIDTSGTLEDTLRQTRDVYASLVVYGGRPA